MSCSLLVVWLVFTIIMTFEGTICSIVSAATATIRARSCGSAWALIVAFGYLQSRGRFGATQERIYVFHVAQLTLPFRCNIFVRLLAAIEVILTDGFYSSFLRFSLLLQ